MNKQNNAVKTLDVEDFQRVFGETLSDYVKGCIKEYKFEYGEISLEEFQLLLLKIVKTLMSDQVVKAGEHRLDEWEKGWSENLNLIHSGSSTVNNLIPKYFEKYNVVRWNSRFIQPLTERFEKNSLSIILDWIFDKKLRGVKSIYEFGCGTGHNLFRARAVNKEAKLWGLDWASSSQKIINKMREDGVDENIFSHNFDYFKPDYAFELDADSVIYTVASLEQIGPNWKSFVDYLLLKKPKLCIHIEPIGELLSQDVLLDYLSIEYFKKRNYLDGFLDGLKALEKDGKAKIHQQQRTYIGSLFIEGYSLVIWSPV